MSAGSTVEAGSSLPPWMVVEEEGGKSWGTMLAALLAPWGWVCVLGSHRPGSPSRTSSLILGPSEVSVLGRTGVSLTAESQLLAALLLPSGRFVA